MPYTVRVFAFSLTLPAWFGSRNLGDSGGRQDRRARRSSASESSDVALTGPDAALLQRIRANDEAAFGELFRMYYAPLAGYASALVLDAEDGKEIVCDLFARIYLGRASWTPSGGIRAYLFRAVRNRALNLIRDRQVAERRSSEAARELKDVAQSTFDDTYGRDAMALVDAAIAALPDRAREAASLRWRQGMSLDEIAVTMGIAKPSAAMLLSRTLKTLRERVLSQLR